MAIFKKIVEGASRTDLRKALKFTPDNSLTNRMDMKTRVNLEKEIFPSSKYGDFISPREFDLKMTELNRKMLGTVNPTEKAKIQHQINLLKQIRQK